MKANGAMDILIVDDNPTDAELAIHALRESKLANRIVWVKDGAEALDLIFNRGTDAAVNERPKLILLDLRLPKVDGLEVLKALKADDGTREIPVVIMTSSNEDRDLVDSYRLGVNSYISKPVEFEEFVGVVTQVGLYWLVVNRVPL